MAHRTHSQDKSLPKARATLMGCIGAVKQRYQDFEPSYDTAYFE